MLLSMSAKKEILISFYFSHCPLNVFRARKVSTAAIKWFLSYQELPACHTVWKKMACSVLKFQWKIPYLCSTKEYFFYCSNRCTQIHTCTVCEQQRGSASVSSIRTWPAVSVLLCSGAPGSGAPEEKPHWMHTNLCKKHTRCKQN